MASHEETLRAGLDWAKASGYSIERAASYGLHCDAIQALLLHDKTNELASKVLGVTSEWVRAFKYGFAGNQPHLKSGDGEYGGAALEKPVEAFQLGQKLGLEFCGPTTWKFAV
jgi:hypothetical protein